jgi:two-component system chemotaxis response regulator CheY
VKILIADDSRVMRQIISRTLRQAGFSGYNVIEAVDGKDALEKTIDQKPDLVLSDWNMPEMNGIQLLRELRANGVTVPFGFVTSEGTTEMRGLADDAGALFLVSKPFTADQLREVLDPVLG